MDYRDGTIFLRRDVKENDVFTGNYVGNAVTVVGDLQNLKGKKCENN